MKVWARVGMSIEVPEDVILDFAEIKGNWQLSIEELYTDPCSIGRVLALSYSDVIGVLERLQNEGKLRLARTAGLNQVVISSPWLAILL